MYTNKEGTLDGALSSSYHTHLTSVNISVYKASPWRPTTGCGSVSNFSRTKICKLIQYVLQIRLCYVTIWQKQCTKLSPVNISLASGLLVNSLHTFKVVNTSSLNTTTVNQFGCQWLRWSWSSTMEDTLLLKHWKHKVTQSVISFLHHLCSITFSVS